MIFDFNNDIDIVYSLDCLIKKELDELELYNPKDLDIDLNNLYVLYKGISKNSKDKILEIGSFSKKAEYVLNNNFNINEYKLFDDYFNNFKIRKKIKNDILSNEELGKIDLDYLELFYKKKLKGNIIVYMTPFVSGAFGLKKSDLYYIILGVKYKKEKQKFVSCGTLVPKIIHELSHPIINEKIKDMRLCINNDMLNMDCYDENQIEELLVRVLEIYNSGKFLGNEYVKWALNEQDMIGFTNVRKIFNIIDKEEILNIDNFIDLLIMNNIIEKI